MNTRSPAGSKMLRASSNLLLMLLLGNVALRAETPEQRAWKVLQDALQDDHASKRATAVQVLGLLRGDAKARKLSEEALKDEREEVRGAAAYALGKMGAKASIPKLKEALEDKEVSVVLAASQALLALGDPAGYDVYSAILAGEREGNKGRIASQRKKLKDPKRLAEYGFEQGIDFLPFAGLGWEALKALAKDDVSPVRAAAAKQLATDPDPRSGEELVQSVSDRSWIVRVAALDALARRGDPALLPGILPALDDDKDAVRFTAAAALLRLSAIAQKRPATPPPKSR